MTARLADAQLVLARSYDAGSWPRLVVVCELIDAAVHERFDTPRELAVSIPKCWSIRAVILDGATP
jgi:hypothetical protein